jgi:hypothetical protein
VGQANGLPTGYTPDDADYVRQLKLADVNKWIAAAEETSNRELYFMAQCMYTHALDYVVEVAKIAPDGPHKVRKKFFQRASAKYRFTFV